MKVNLPEGMKLSIGMIVKNEHKHIRNCLEALKELRENVRSELIITDTGSDDDTLDIVREYADQVIEYQWDGDFSAARNTTYDAAKGEWYLFLDADEYFDDVEDLVKFLNGKESHKYNTATYRIRNRLNLDGSVYNEFRAARVFRKDKSRRFINRVHETIPVIGPVKNLESMAIHHGYFYETTEAWEKKQKRNMELMLQELEETPDDPRLLAHIADSAPVEERLDYLLHAEEIVKKDAKHPYFRGVYRRLATEYMRLQRMEDAADILDLFFKEKPQGDDVVDMDIRASQAMALHNLKRLDEAEGAYEAFFDLCDRYHKGTLCLDGQMFGTVDYIRPAMQNDMKLNQSNCLQALKRFSEAMRCISELDFNIMSKDKVEAQIRRALLLARDSHEYSEIPNLYAQLKQQDDFQKVQVFILNQEKYIFDIPDSRKDLAQAYLENGMEDDYTEYMRLLAHEEDTDEFLEELNSYIEKTEHWEAGYTETACLAVKYGCNLMPAVKKSTSEQLEDLMTRLAEEYKGKFAEWVLIYPKEDLESSIKGIFLLTAMMQKAFFAGTGLKLEDRTFLAQQFAGYLSAYIDNIYNPELLNDDDIGVLPPLHRFGYYIGIAERFYESGDEKGYLSNIRRAIKEDSRMKEIGAVLLEEVKAQRKKEQEEREQAEKALENYAAIVKQKIMVLIQQGLHTEAYQTLQTYEKICPDDPELNTLYGKLQLKKS